MSDYPEHDKMQAAQPAAQNIGDFLEWLTGERGLTLSEYIDRDVIDEEKRQMLELARAQNAAAGVVR